MLTVNTLTPKSAPAANVANWNPPNNAELSFGIKKESRVATVASLTPQAAPVADVEKQKTSIPVTIPGNSVLVYNPADDELAANYCSG